MVSAKELPEEAIGETVTRELSEQESDLGFSEQNQKKDTEDALTESLLEETSLKKPECALTDMNLVKSADSLKRNALQIENCNGYDLMQNSYSSIKEMELVEVKGSFYSAEVTQNAFQSECGWLNSDRADGKGGYLTLPYYRFKMKADADQTIRVYYPEAGYYKGEKIAAVVTFSEIHSFGEPGASEDAKELFVATNLYAGYWYFGISDMKVNVKFYNPACLVDMRVSEDTETISDPDMYLTFNSLNGCPRSQLSTEIAATLTEGDSTLCYGEFVGYADDTEGTKPGFMLSDGYEFDENGNVTNLRSVMLEIRSVYNEEGSSDICHVFIGYGETQQIGGMTPSVSWEDVLGKETFPRNSVSLLLESPDTEFIVGKLGTGFAWNCFSSAAIFADVEAPVKKIVKAQNKEGDVYSDVEITQEGHSAIITKEGKAGFEIKFRLPKMGVETTNVFQNFVISDELDRHLELIPDSIRITDPSGEDISVSSETGTLTAEPHLLEYEFTKEYLDDPEHYTGEDYTVYAEAYVKWVEDSDAPEEQLQEGESQSLDFVNAAAVYFNDPNRESPLYSQDVVLTILKPFEPTPIIQPEKVTPAVTASVKNNTVQKTSVNTGDATPFELVGILLALSFSVLLITAVLLLGTSKKRSKK